MRVLELQNKLKFPKLITIILSRASLLSVTLVPRTLNFLSLSHYSVHSISIQYLALIYNPSISSSLHLHSYPIRKNDLISFFTTYGLTSNRYLSVVAKLRQATISFVMYDCLSVHPPVRPHEITGIPLDGFSLKLMFEYFSKICRDSSSLIKI
jgi:hypothetical protein